MEVKLLELAKRLLRDKSTNGMVKQQYHDKVHAQNQSGMICSGEQTVVLMPVTSAAIPIVAAIVEQYARGITSYIHIQPGGMALLDNPTAEYWQTSSETTFEGVMAIEAPRRVHIFGGGHVGLALSEILSLLNYYVIIYDDRAGLNTLAGNRFADDIRIVDFGQIQSIEDLFANDTVLLVTFSYRTDKLLLTQLYQRPFAYIGMMGSETKIKTLYAEFEQEGVPPEQLQHVHAPIGLPILSKTTMEIAISVAAELIYQANKDLPTGRQSPAKSNLP